MNKSLQDEIKASYISKNADNLAKDSLENLRMVSLVSLAISGIFTVLTFSFYPDGLTVYLSLLYFYLMLITFAYLTNRMLTIQKIKPKKVYRMTLEFLGLMSLGLIFISVYVINDFLAIFFILFLVLYPTLFLLKEQHMIEFLIGSGILFLVASFFNPDRSLSTFYMDLYLILTGLLIGVPINWMVLRLRRKELYMKELFIAYSHLDELTKLPNRRAFNLHIDEVFNYNRANHISLGVALIDIDDFKLYNDAYGHLEGDNILEQLGNIIQNHLTKNTFFARFGGEEFIGVFTDQTNEQIQTCLSNICKDIIHSKIINQETKREVTVSIGYHNELDLSKTTYMKVIDYADIALYKAKIYGKNRIEMYTEE
jgi:diguanylate cyclase (GGDEF)-like protein